jgi:hypothetical protein
MPRTEDNHCEYEKHDIGHDDDRRHCGYEKENQRPRPAPGVFLLLYKIHRHGCPLVAQTRCEWKLQMFDALVSLRATPFGS